MRVTAVAPCRADLAGGTLDIWPLGILHPGAVTCNVAVPVTVELEVDDTAPEGIVEHQVHDGAVARLTRAEEHVDLTAAIAFHLRPTGGIRVRVLKQAPMGSGLGGSSTYGVALAKAITATENMTIDDQTVVHLVRDLEARILQVATGTQDHWAAIMGGAIVVHLEPGGERVERLHVEHDWISQRLTLFFTGLTHHSGFVNWQVIRRRMDRDRKTTARLQAIAEAAIRCRAALVGMDTEGVAEALCAEWSNRKALAPEVCPDELRMIERSARTAGALAFKACGAGGGGSILAWHAPDQKEAVGAALVGTAPDGCLFESGPAARGCIINVDSVG